MLAHLMEVYADQGQRDFVLAGGYKIELLAVFAADLPGSWKEPSSSRLTAGSRGSWRSPGWLSISSTRGSSSSTNVPFPTGPARTWSEKSSLRSAAPVSSNACHRHGFWKSMDTYKDALDLSNPCADGPGPWMGSV